jgi:hypothetical protein
MTATLPGSTTLAVTLRAAGCARPGVRATSPHPGAHLPNLLPDAHLVASRDGVRPPSARATARPLDAVNAQMTCGGMLPSGARVQAPVWSICR